LTNSIYESGFRFNYPLQLVIIATFILGGLGFPIVVNIVKYTKHKLTNLFRFQNNKKIYKPWIINLNSRITLITTLSPADGVAVARITSIMGDFYDIVDLSPTVIGTPSVTNEPTVFTAKDVDVKTAIEANIDTWKIAVTNWIDDNFVDFTYNNDICFRDVGLIVQAVADDIFGEVANWSAVRLVR
jgi:hypothetical protein